MENTSNEYKSSIFQFMIPNNSLVSDFELHVNGKWYKAEILKKDDAKSE